MKSKFVVLLCLGLVACSSSSDSKDPVIVDRELFSSTFEDQRCFRDINPNLVSYFRWTIGFDSDGYNNHGRAHYDDENCENLMYQEDGRISTYPYSIGENVSTSNSGPATKLLFPDPESVGIHGSVFTLSDDNGVCQGSCPFYSCCFQ